MLKLDRKLNIAFVVQRYGLEVNGGAELHCRQLAEKMVKYHNIEILTTCALDYVKWSNYYPEGTEIINDINVRRFKVDVERDIKDFNNLSDKVLVYEHSYIEEIQWMWKQGPVSTHLLKFIEENKDNYDVFIFMTYLYFTTYMGLQIVPEKSILIPTAHDEPPIYLKIFNPFFHLPRGIFYNTSEEKNFINKKFYNSYVKSNIGGVGVDVPDISTLTNFRDKYHLNSNYIIYIGRIDPSKGCHQLFSYFIKYKSRNPNDLKLVLIGKLVMELPEHKDIISLGFLSDKDKFSGIASSKALILPSKYESLSMVVLESMAMERPVLVNGECAVLSGHCLKSNAGMFYSNYEEFEACLNLLLTNNKLSSEMGKNGSKYVLNNYRWEQIEEKLNDLIKQVFNY